MDEWRISPISSKNEQQNVKHFKIISWLNRLTLRSVPSILTVSIFDVLASTQYKRSPLMSRANPLGHSTPSLTKTFGFEPSIPDVAINGLTPQSDQNIILKFKKMMKKWMNFTNYRFIVLLTLFSDIKQGTSVYLYPDYEEQRKCNLYQRRLLCVFLARLWSICSRLRNRLPNLPVDPNLKIKDD